MMRLRGDLVDVLYEPGNPDNLVVDYESEVHKAQQELVDNRSRIEAAKQSTSERREKVASARARLDELVDLHARGTLSDDQFREERRRLLGELG